MIIEVSRADDSDCRELIVLTCEYLREVAMRLGLGWFDPDREKMAEKLAEFLGMPDYAVFLARSPKGHPLGFCTVFDMPVQIREEPYAILDKLYVREEFRRRQIAHELLVHAKRFARSQKARLLQAKLPDAIKGPETEEFFRAEKFYATGGHKFKIGI